MEAEKLKVIAEGMGCGGKINMINYNPLTNDTQCFACYKLLLDKGFVMAASEQDASYAIYLLGKFICEGETPQEAVCNAAYEYFKGE